MSMARALALSPQLLLADEAFSGVDEVTARQLRGDFLQAARKRGTTVILVTHQLEEAIEVGERILVLGRPGRLLMDVRPDVLLRRESAKTLRTKIQKAMEK